MMNKLVPVSVMLVLTACMSMPLRAQSRVPTSVIGNGATRAGSSSVILYGTLGQAVIGVTSSGSQSALQGFWYTLPVALRSGVRETHHPVTGILAVALQQNVPNPFHTETEVQLQLPYSGHVSLRMYDALGREVQTLIDGTRAAGTLSLRIGAGELSSGRYLLQLDFEGHRRTISMMLVK